MINSSIYSLLHIVFKLSKSYILRLLDSSINVDVELSKNSNMFAVTTKLGICPIWNDFQTSQPSTLNNVKELIRI